MIWGLEGPGQWRKQLARKQLSVPCCGGSVVDFSFSHRTWFEDSTNIAVEQAGRPTDGSWQRNSGHCPAATHSQRGILVTHPSCCTTRQAADCLTAFPAHLHKRTQLMIPPDDCRVQIAAHHQAGTRTLLFKNQCAAIQLLINVRQSAFILQIGEWKACAPALNPTATSAPSMNAREGSQ